MIEIPHGYLFRQTLKRRTLARIMQSYFLKGKKVNGDAIDLGGSERSQYYLSLDTDDVCSIRYADLYREGDNILKVDFEEKFDIDSASFDTVILMNVAEHVFNFKNLFSESHRILRNNGEIVGVVPFLYQVHGVPNDYFRYTIDSLHILLSNSGFADVVVYPIGCGPFTAAASLVGHKLKIKPIAYFVYIVSMWLDRRVAKNGKSENNYPLSYYFTAKKKV